MVRQGVENVVLLGKTGIAKGTALVDPFAQPDDVNIHESWNTLIMDR